MVAKEQISKLKVKYQTSELNVIREYFQHLFLQFFYQLPQSHWAIIKDFKNTLEKEIERYL